MRSVGRSVDFGMDAPNWSSLAMVAPLSPSCRRTRRNWNGMVAAPSDVRSEPPSLRGQRGRDWPGAAGERASGRRSSRTRARVCCEARRQRGLLIPLLLLRHLHQHCLLLLLPRDDRGPRARNPAKNLGMADQLTWSAGRTAPHPSPDGCILDTVSRGDGHDNRHVTKTSEDVPNGFDPETRRPIEM